MKEDERKCRRAISEVHHLLIPQVGWFHEKVLEMPSISLREAGHWERGCNRSHIVWKNRAAILEFYPGDDHRTPPTASGTGVTST